MYSSVLDEFDELGFGSKRVSMPFINSEKKEQIEAFLDDCVKDCNTIERSPGRNFFNLIGRKLEIDILMELNK